MRRQRGFTLVELIVVIVILGILAAMALPRFAGMQGDARLSKMQGLLGSMRSASAMAHSAQLVTINSTHNTEVTIEGNKVAMNSGYPTAKGILVASGLLKETAAGSATAPTTGALGDYYLSYYAGATGTDPGYAVVAPDQARKDQCVVLYVESTSGLQSSTPPQIGVFDHAKAPLGISLDLTGLKSNLNNLDKLSGKADAGNSPSTAAAGTATDVTITGRDCE